jgi:hypothetical protein
VAATRLEDAGGAEALEVTILRFGNAPFDNAPHEIRSAARQRIVVTQRVVSAVSVGGGL